MERASEQGTAQQLRVSDSRRTSSERGTTPEPSRQSSEKLRPIGRALGLLCDAKRMDFTPRQLSTWVQGWSCFSSEAVVMATTAAALSSDPFPQLGDLIRAIQREQNKAATTPTQGDPDRLSIGTVRAVVKALRIKKCVPCA